MTAGLLAFLAWCVYLGLEARRLRRWRASIPLLITVTGTRGKSTLVRLLHAVLRESGRSVLAKTTGSEALLLLPDGREEPLRRRGIPSILEQIRLLRRGADLEVDVVVAEVMSIHPENHLVESRRILRADVVLVTNLRVDHTEAVGASRGEVGALHVLDVPPGASVYLPREEAVPEFIAGVEEAGGSLELVPNQGPGGAALALRAESPCPESLYPEALDLLRAACRSLDIPEATIRSGIGKAKGDSGALWVGRYGDGSAGPKAFTASAFAANDPASTLLALERASSRLRGDSSATSGPDPRPVIGVLNLRRDRGDRTQQWMEVLETGVMGELQHLFVMGFHGPAVRARLARRGWEGRVHHLKERDPARATAELLARAGGEAPLIFGFGNFGGMGGVLADHWRTNGRPVREGKDGV